MNRVEFKHEEGIMSRIHGGLLTVLVAAGAALLTGCASAPPLKEQAVSKPLAPMPKAERELGYKIISLRDGTEFVRTLTEQTADTETWTDSTGCRVVLPRTGFAPTLEFINCEGNSGRQTITLLRGTPYPLILGSTWVYAFSGSSNRGTQWRGERHCAVDSTARIKPTALDKYMVFVQSTSVNRKLIGNTKFLYEVEDWSAS